MPHRPAAMMALFDLITEFDTWYSTALRQLGLTPVRARALHGLYTEGPQRQHALSTLSGCSPQQMNGILEALEGRGWVVRNPDPQDGRATSISLTTTGWELAKLIEALRVEAVEELFGPMADADVDRFVVIVNDLRQRIETSTMDLATTQERLAAVGPATRNWTAERP